MERTYISQTYDQNTPVPASPSQTTSAVQKVAGGIGNVIAIPLAILIAVVAVLFLLVALQPILSILVALLVFPILIPVSAFVLIWFDVGDPVRADHR